MGKAKEAGGWTGELTKLMEISEKKGSRTQSMGASSSPYSYFSPLFKGAGG